MRVPERLESLLDQGVIDDVIRPLMAGKEAQIYLVESRGELRVAKVYKESMNRSFRNRSEYAEGRRVRNTRQQRAMEKRSKYGREEVEAAWRHAEVDAIYRARAAGVRVPEPYEYVDGVLVMELVADRDGEPAPRLADMSFGPREAQELFDELVREVTKLLCAGIVHGDLSDFNVLLGHSGPVIIDFPQWVDAAHNRNARKLLIRDVDNLQSFLGRYATQLRSRRYGREMWDLYEHNELRPETLLTGTFRERAKAKADPYALLREFEELEREARARRERLGLPMRPARRPVVSEKPIAPVAPPPPAQDGAPEGKKRRRRRKKKPAAPESDGPGQAEEVDDLDALLLVED